MVETRHGAAPIKQSAGGRKGDGTIRQISQATLSPDQYGRWVLTNMKWKTNDWSCASEPSDAIWESDCEHGTQNLHLLQLHVK